MMKSRLSGGWIFAGVALIIVTAAANLFVYYQVQPFALLGERFIGPDQPSAEIQPGSPEDFLINVGDRVFFSFQSSDLTPAARATLERQAEWLQRFPARRVVIEGHTDGEERSREAALTLGERRANAMKDYLIALGISSSRITTITYGKEQPAVLGATEAAFAQNRRGVVVVN